LRLSIVLLLSFFSYPAWAVCPSVDPYHPEVSEEKQQAPELCYLGFSLKHDNDLKVPIWVTYLLTIERAYGCLPREDKFRPDPSLEGAGATLSDYADPRFDRGHNAPAGDMLWDKQAERESFYLSNMTPQRSGLNRGPWRVIEQIVRAWGAVRGKIVVVTGPIFEVAPIERTKINGVAVPTGYYKVVYDPTTREAVSFIISQEATGKLDFNRWVATLEAVKVISGVSPLPGFPVDVQLSAGRLWPYNLKAFRDERARRCTAAR
jgi:endonuclease G